MPRLPLLVSALLLGAGCFNASAGDVPIPWKEAPLPAPAAGKALYGVCGLPDGKHGWIVGAEGLCLSTSDGGQTWEKRETGSGATLLDVRFNDATHGWAVGNGDPNAPQARGHVVMMPGMAMKSSTLLITEDGGKTWQAHWVPTNFELWAVETSAAPALQICPSGGDQHLDGDNLRCNGGKGWSSDRIFRALFDLRAQDAEHWIAVGSPVSVGFMPTPTSELYTTKKCRALFSKDGGKSWSVSKGTEVMKGRCLRGLAVKKGAPAIAVGDGGTILLSEDAGEAWKAVESGTAEGLKRVAYAHGEGKLAVGVGSKGVVLVSGDAGQTWKAVGGGAAGALTHLSACGDCFVAVSKEGKVFRAKAADLAAAAK